MYIFNKIGWFVMGATCSVICSCGDILNSAPDGKISLADAFNESEKVAAWLNTCYTYIPIGGIQYHFQMRGPVCWCDESWDADAEAEPSLKSGQYYIGNATAAVHPILRDESAFWGRFWPAIRKCTYLITNIDAAPVDATDKSRWKAEAHLLRAFYYAELLRWFGCGLPIERETYSYTQDFSQVKRASYYETVQFVLEECDAALSSPDLPWRIVTGAEGYRVTKAMAEAIKARMILYAASPLYNQGQNYWEEAYQISKTALANLRTNEYELYNAVHYPATWEDPEVFLPNTHAKLFNEYFCSTMEYSSGTVDKETIYQTQGEQLDIWAHDGVGAQLGYKTGTCPSQELVDCFETDDGIPILDLARPYLDEVTHLQPNFHPDQVKYNEQDPYVDRDPRFYASIYYNGSKRKANWLINETSDCIENFPGDQGFRVRIIATWTGEPQTGIHPTDRKATRTGYYERKFNHPFAGLSINDLSGAQNKSFRLGEVILNFAEAAAEAGHLDEARDAVDEIRRRVNMPPLPPGLSQEELILRVRHERRVELAMEGFRYFDVRRWSSPGDDLEKTDRWITAMHITRNSDGSYTYNRGPVSVERYCWAPKFLYLPIPMDEVNIMKAHTGENWQNPEWE
ncbi:MAG: RagB/SusD family nutrient uptake outer membrane protein [Bacteroidales bacterium]|jgi:hypothetical protein|nr:RagB/SusD family nutrient uptake outer membrane protein [Bacteroidales bacterium]